MAERVIRAGLQVDATLAQFIETEALTGLTLAPDSFWEGLAALVTEFAPRNAALLAERDKLQRAIDAWYVAHRGKPVALDAYREMLTRIGYLQPEGPDFEIETENVDPEFATIAGTRRQAPAMIRPAARGRSPGPSHSWMVRCR